MCPAYYIHLDAKSWTIDDRKCSANFVSSRAGLVKSTEKVRDENMQDYPTVEKTCMECGATPISQTQACHKMFHIGTENSIVLEYA